MTTPTTQPRIYPPASYQLTLKLSQGGQPAVVVLGATGQPGGANVSALNAAGWRDGIWSQVRDSVASTVQCTGAIMRATHVADGISVEVGPPASPNGGNTGASTVAAASYLLKWSTNAGGRSGKGRTFIPGVLAAQVQADGRTLASVIQGNMSVAAANYVASFTTGPHGELDPAVLSFTKGTAATILSGSCASLIGIQRRRMRD